MSLLEKQVPEKYINWGIAAATFAAAIVVSLYITPPKQTARGEAAHAVVPKVPAVLGAESSPRGLSTKALAAEPALVEDLDFSGVSAKSFLVYDAATGKILAEKDGDLQVSIASLTKLLTALVVYEHGDMEEYFTAKAEDSSKFSPVLGLVPGDSVKVHDVFNAMLVGSENDAALALSRYVSEKTGEDFIALMNRKAEELGMKDSNFSNPMGFDSWRNYSTAQDLRKLVAEIQKYAVFTNLGKTKYYSFESEDGTTYRAVATNKLIGKDSTIEAIKTGYTANTQGAMIVKVTQEGNSFIIILLGSQDREADTVRLKNIVEKSFAWK